MSNQQNDSILKFWDDRASLGDLAGTNDFVLTGIEQAFLANNVQHGVRVLDIGCGNGSSLIKIVSQNECNGVGIDFSDEMIKLAKQASLIQGLENKINWHRCNVPPVSNEWGQFDVAYSQRCLINLTSTEQQKEAVLSVKDSLKSGGTYIMMECFSEGSEETNLLRRRLGLLAMDAPWHNLFFNLHEVKSWSTEAFYVEKVVHISSTYHFLSRVVNAKLMADSGGELKYDSPINLLAAQLPQELGEFGPVKACIWRKA
jgi:ubiquinone/menaquinone biosynthesis C-methylase UbiE